MLLMKNPAILGARIKSTQIDCKLLSKLIWKFREPHKIHTRIAETQLRHSALRAFWAHLRLLVALPVEGARVLELVELHQLALEDDVQRLRAQVESPV